MTAGAATVQAHVVAFLSDAGAYSHETGPIQHVQTHISHVFLAGAYVYKMKKAVTFAFLDFARLEAREHDCREELRLNRRLAAPVYLDVVPVTDEGGRLRLGGAGTPIEWLVRMRRLPAERALAALVEAGQVPADGVDAVATRIAAFHAAAPVVAGGDPDGLRAAWSENLDGVRPMVGRFLTAEDFAVLEDFGRTYVIRHDAMLRARVDRGHVRDGHGDLRADHVYLLDEPLPALPDAPAVPAGVTVVDCLEFSPALRAVDVAADLSFLAMELEGLGQERLAQRLVERYAAVADDAIVPALVPYHACHRAIVRGKVEGLAAGEAELEPGDRERAAMRARAAFALAGRFAWRSGDPVVIASVGLSGSGKSAVAGMLAESAGVRVLSSDVLRRATTPQGAPRVYTVVARESVYATLRREVERALGARESVIVDATFLARAERDRLARTVRGFGWRHVFVECVADEAVVRRRLEARDASSVSDARWDVYVQQRATADPLAADEPVLRVDTSGTLEAVRRTLVPRLWDWRQNRPTARDAPA
jgi:aminoglycoside phosphotransferase family enzyme/predicted kinase